MAGDVDNGAGEAGDVFSHTPFNSSQKAQATYRLDGTIASSAMVDLTIP